MVWSLLARRWVTNERIPSNREPIKVRFLPAAGFAPGGILFCASLRRAGLTCPYRAYYRTNPARRSSATAYCRPIQGFQTTRTEIPL